MAYTDKPVTLADIMNVKGESLMPSTSLLNEEYLTVDGDEMDTGKQATKPGLVTSTTSDQPRSVSVGKKKIAFLSDQLQKKLNTEPDIALRQLVKVCVCVCVCV